MTALEILKTHGLDHAIDYLAGLRKADLQDEAAALLKAVAAGIEDIDDDIDKEVRRLQIEAHRQRLQIVDWVLTFADAHQPEIARFLTGPDHRDSIAETLATSSVAIAAALDRIAPPAESAQPAKGPIYADDGTEYRPPTERERALMRGADGSDGDDGATLGPAEWFKTADADETPAIAGMIDLAMCDVHIAGQWAEMIRRARHEFGWPDLANWPNAVGPASRLVARICSAYAWAILAWGAREEAADAENTECTQ